MQHKIIAIFLHVSCDCFFFFQSELTVMFFLLKLQSPLLSFMVGKEPKEIFLEEIGTTNTKHMHISIWYHPASIFIALLEHSITWKKFNRKITVLTFSIRCFGLLHVILSRTTCYRNSFLTHGMLMLYACNPSVWEVVESKGSEVQNPFLLYFGFNTTLDNMGACSKKSPLV